MQRVAPVSSHVTQGIQAQPCSQSARFQDSWWRQFDKPEEGFVDTSGFMSRLPLRLESTEVIVHGICDANKMMADFPHEDYVPVLYDGKAVVSFWFNNFKDTDCGGEYWETWYNTYVSPKDKPQINVPAEEGPIGVAGHPEALSFLCRVVCGDTPRNPGAAQKAVNGGRQLWGFSKHRDLGELSFLYNKDATEVNFNAKHLGKQIIAMSVRLPEADEGAITVPLEAESAKGGLISCPRHSGQVDNMGRQTRYSTAVKCTQHVKPWDPKTDSLVLGDDDFYAAGPKRWGFIPVLKVHSPDFKIVAWGPEGRASGEAAAAAIAEHEKKLASGAMGGTL